MILDTLENFGKYIALNPLFPKVADLPASNYDAAKDITFYDGPAEKYIKVCPGEFVIFFPQDGHAPCIADTAEIQKVIFKIKA